MVWWEVVLASCAGSAMGTMFILAFICYWQAHKEEDN